VNRAGSVLRCCRDRFLCLDVGLHESLGTPLSLKGIEMEYAIAGTTAIFLFIYLMYALLRPERF